jgi:hypothetical protein
MWMRIINAMPTAKQQVNLISYVLMARVADTLTFHGRLAMNFQHAAGHTHLPTTTRRQPIFQRELWTSWVTTACQECNGVSFHASQCLRTVRATSTVPTPVTTAKPGTKKLHTEYTVYSDITLQLTYYERTLVPYNILYNVLQCFTSAIQYIAILQFSNTIYCNTSDQQYNILQYFRSTMQYIAILLIIQYIVLVTMYCNTSEQQYNILQYFYHTIYCIGYNILQYIVIQYFVAQPW